jgi:predicted ATPase/DNA-binding CsgD family transcriptional regulator
MGTGAIAQRRTASHGTRFVGREAELAELQFLTTTARVLTLVGPAGSGKSALAAQLAADTDAALPNGIVQLDVSELRRAGALERVLAVKLGAPSSERLVDWLAERPIVVFLDNCDDHIVECADLVARLIRRCRSLQVVATSREPLGINGEVVWRVPLLSSYDATTLFVERLHQRRRNFALKSDDASAIARICRRLGGLPLALEIVARHVSISKLRLEATRVSLRSVLDLRAGRSARAHHRSLRAVLDSTYARLTPQERVLLRRLAVFVGGWNLEAAQAVCVDADLRVESIAGLLDRLALKSLIEIEHSDPQPTRYQFLNVTRQYAVGLLETAGEFEIVRQRHAVYFMQLGMYVHPARLDVSHARRLETDQGNLRAALHWSIRRRRPELACQLAIAGYAFWYLRGRFAEGKAWLRRCATLRVPAQHASLRALASSFAAHLALLEGEPLEARQALNDALTAQQKAGNHQGIALATYLLALVAWWTGDVGGAQQLCVETRSALKDVPREDDLTRMIDAASLTLSARCAWNSGDYHRAGQMATQAAQAARAREDRLWLARALHVQALVAESAGVSRHSTWLADRAIALQTEGEDADGLVDTLCARGHFALSRGSLPQAQQAFKEALRLAESSGLILGQVWALEGAARALETVRPADSVQLTAACEQLRDTLGCRPSTLEKRRSNQSLGRARARLTATAYSAARAAGRRLDRRQALRLGRLILSESPSDDAAVEHLTARENQVAQLIARGLSNSQIALGLAVSVGTVRTHVDHILSKLGMHSRAQIAVWTLAR